MEFLYITKNIHFLIRTGGKFTDEKSLEQLQNCIFHVFKDSGATGRVDRREYEIYALFFSVHRNGNRHCISGGRMDLQISGVRKFIYGNGTGSCAGDPPVEFI